MDESTSTAPVVPPSEPVSMTPVTSQPAINEAPDISPVDIVNLTLEERVQRLEAANNIT